MFLSENSIAQIKQGALHIMENTGLRLPLPEAIEILRRAGCRVEGDLVRFPPTLVEASLASVPSSWTIYDQTGEPKLLMGAGNTYYATADVAIEHLDYRTGEKRPFMLDDTVRAARLVNHLDNIDIVCPFGTPSDVDPERAPVIAFDALIRETDKPIAFVCQNVATLREVYEIAAGSRGGFSELVDKPFLFTLLESSSPLLIPKETLEKILWMTTNRLPFFAATSISLGATTPATMAGAMAQLLAEGLAAVVLAQVNEKGCPVGMGAGLGVLTKNGGHAAVGPDHDLGTAAFAELVSSLDMPAWAHGLDTESKTPDGQAMIETFSSTYLPTLGGADVVYDAGYLESGMMSSLEMVTVFNEIAGFVRHLQKGIEVNDETIATDLIGEVGPGGNFLGEKHTAQHFRKDLWFPELLDWNSYNGWEAEGKKTLHDRVVEKICRILDEDGLSQPED
jgi:trimethylamine--corrinoid protein Co-methyltransferase